MKLYSFLDAGSYFSFNLKRISGGIRGTTVFFNKIGGVVYEKCVRPDCAKKCHRNFSWNSSSWILNFLGQTP